MNKKEKELFAQAGKIKNLPKAVEKYAWKHAEFYSFFKKNKGIATCTCSACGAVYEKQYKHLSDDVFEAAAEHVEEVEAHKFGKCPVCQSKVEYLNRNKNPIKNFINAYYVMKHKDGLIMRLFQIGYETVPYYQVRTEIVETFRQYLFPGATFHIYHLHDNWRNTDIWDTNNYGHTFYNYTENIINKAVLQEKFKYFDDITKVWKLRAYNRCPVIEKIRKAGFKEIAEDIEYKEGRVGYIDKKAKDLKDILMIDHNDWQFFRKNHSFNVLSLLQKKKKGWKITYDQIEYIVGNHRFYYFDRLIEYMSPTNAIKALNRKWSLSTYLDYLQMRKELGYDLTNTVFLFPKNLRKVHNDMVLESNKRKNEEFINKMLKQYPMKATHKYDFARGDFTIRAAADAREIINEGRTLHHCVGQEHYIKKHKNKISVICFLRYKDAPDVPYITVEYDPKDKKILQWYMAYDKKGDNPKKIDRWLECWIKQLDKKKERKAS
ncbi:MAG: hypothetical protein E7242_05840 [Lachnospiraceae bacterium]|nr:hypothetical protein [Lachnospiraceae bacterium]